MIAAREAATALARGLLRHAVAARCAAARGSVRARELSRFVLGGRLSFGGAVLVALRVPRRRPRRLLLFCKTTTGRRAARGRDVRAAAHVVLHDRELVRGDAVAQVDHAQTRVAGVPALREALREHGEVVERDALFKKVWETNYTGDTRTLDVHISWLRRAIELDPNNPKFLKTIRGVGYRLDV